jgi:hypothetical protein
VRMGSNGRKMSDKTLTQGSLEVLGARMRSNEREMSEGVRGIYRARKQQTSSPRGVRSRTITQQSKSCFVRPGIT